MRQNREDGGDKMSSDGEQMRGQQGTTRRGIRAGGDDEGMRWGEQGNENGPKFKRNRMSGRFSVHYPGEIKVLTVIELVE